MSSRFPWRMAAKIAWRESRASSAKFLFVVLAIAVGVGSLTGVRGFSRAFRDMLLRQARTLMAADLSVRVFELASPDQQAVLDSLERRGVRRTWITETVSMMAPAGASEPLLVSVKAVDPTIYPFYGAVRVEPAGGLADALTSNTVGVSEDGLLRLGVRVGDTVKLGAAEFRIAARVVAEPDRMAGSLNVGPRVLITRAGLDRTELLRPGSRASQRFLFKLPPVGLGVEQLRQELKRAFPDAMIADFRETHPVVTRGLDRATMFLSLVSLIALIVGALGVATAMHSHLQQKLDNIAVMKSLGGRSGQIIRVYMAQALLLAGLGAALGLALGGVVHAVFPLLIARYFPLKPEIQWEWLSMLEGLSVAVLTTMLFTLPPLLAVRRVRPSLILRREMAEAKPPLRERWRNARAPLAAVAVIVVGIAFIATWLAAGFVNQPRDALRAGAWFAGGLVASLIIMAGLAWLLLRGLRALLRAPAWRLPAALRHGIANLYRPGNHAQAALVALGIGVMFTLTVYLLQHSLLEQIAASAPPGMPNVFLINITEGEHAGVLDLLRRTPGAEGSPVLVGSVAARLVSIDGQPMEKRTGPGPDRRFRRARSVTWARDLPPQTQVVAGAWWKTWDLKAPQVSVSEETARLLRLKPGALLEWTCSGRRLAARVAAIHKTEAIRPGSNIEFILTPGALDGLPVLYFGGVRVRTAAVAALQRDAYRAFPSVTVINIADVLDRVQEVVDQIALVVRFISAFSILAGVIILASSVAGTRFRRLREVVILKTLGATRRRVAGIFSVEFLILGLVAGVLGSLLATGFSSLVLKRLLEADYRFDLLPNVVAVVLTALIANLAGWLASYRILGQKPLEALRQE